MTRIDSGHRVVVGVDGSAASLDAVPVAAADAARRGCPLVVATALSLPAMGAPVGRRMLGRIERDVRDEADRLVAAAAARARQTAPGLPVRTEVVVAPPAMTLVAASADAEVVVLGAHGRGALGDLMVGSVAIEVATHAYGPVVIARGTARPGGPVVVGADGSAHSEAAVGYAFEEADRRGTAVLAVRAWHHSIASYLLPVTETEREAVEIERLGEALRPWRDKYPHVPLELRAVRDGAIAALVDASAHAQLVVVGARGHGGFAGLLLGSVGQGLVHRSHCPVAIVRPGTH